jgi:hypothetical protein
LIFCENFIQRKHSINFQKYFSEKNQKNLAEMVQQKEKRRHNIRPKFNPSNDKGPNQVKQMCIQDEALARVIKRNNVIYEFSL